MKKITAIFLCVLMLVCAAAPAASAATPAEEAKLSFNEDGSFKIMQIADIQDGANLMTLTRDFISAAVEAEQPDLIVLTGDNVAGYRTLNASATEKAIRAYMDIFESFGIPVAMVFGNHDEYNSGLTKEQQMAIYNSYSCDISYDDGEDIWGCGTYNVPIYSSTDETKVAFNCWMFDTGDRDENGEYDHVKKSQIDWYVATSDALKAANGGEAVPSLAFQHIIVPEIFDALEITSSTTEGAVYKFGNYYTLPDAAAPGSVLGECPCPSGYSEGQFEAFTQQGDVLAVVVGHDHCNSYIVPFEGIDLICSPTCGFRSYGDNDSRGIRIFNISESDPSSYKTEIVTFTDYYSDNASQMLKYNIIGFFSEIYAFFNNIYTKLVNMFS